MGTPPVRRLEPLTREKLIKLLDPGRVFYRVPLREHLAEGNQVELTALAKSLREIQAEYKDFDGLIKAVDTAARKAGG
ncbi:MAG: hypothetical protein QOD42_3200 [Sphingomonadales bacterium]|jgi:hypothetical protein|nr:hypothetical protein [Sphingomonadales bacterium]